MKFQLLCLTVFILLIIYQTNYQSYAKTEESAGLSLQIAYIFEDEISFDDLFLPEETAQELSEADLSDSVFIGNSKIEGLRNSGLLLEADYICKVGWNVSHIFDETSAISDELLISGLNKREYDKLFLMFGDNELGWNSTEIFIEVYQEAIEKLHAVQPKAEIYILSVFPVSQSVHNQNRWGVNNTNVVKFNKAIKEMCEEEGYHYLDIHSVLINEAGVLPDSASSDGIHPNAFQLEKVVDYIKENAKE